MSSTAFPRDVRLTHKRQYQAVFGNAKAVRDRYFTVLVRFSNDDTARLGMVVAKKKARRAVDRHRLKRIIRESFRHGRESLPVADIIVLSQAAATQASTEELFQSLDQLWSKVRRLNNNRCRTANS